MAIYDDPEKLLEKVDEFFDTRPIQVEVKVRSGEVIQADNMTQTALARFLGYGAGRGMMRALRVREGEGWKEIADHIDQRFIEYWIAYGQMGDNSPFGKLMLGVYGISDNPLNTRRKIDMGKADTEAQKAGKVLMSGAKGEIEPCVVSSYINSIKSVADIRKTSELEDRLNELEKMAGVNG